MIGNKEMEISVIAEDLWQRELVRRQDPQNAQDLELEQKLYAELNELGFDFYWCMQLESTVFSIKDKEIIPIFKKYSYLFNNTWLIGKIIGCLGVKGFYEATEYLIEKYRKELRLNRDIYLIGSIGTALLTIKDKRFIKEYISILREMTPGYYNMYHMIVLLSKLKVKEALPDFIRLLDCKLPEDKKDQGKSYESASIRSQYNVSINCIEAISQYKDAQYIKYIEKFLEPEKIEWINCESTTKEAKRGIKWAYSDYRKATEKAIKKMMNI